ncbi:hypothetical protein ACOSQ3_016796 [Xanthoceras sorbifolium]
MKITCKRTDHAGASLILYIYIFPFTRKNQVLLTHINYQPLFHFSFSLKYRRRCGFAGKSAVFQPAIYCWFRFPVVVEVCVSVQRLLGILNIVRF